MKKIVIIEVAVLIVLLIAAVIVCVNIPQQNPDPSIMSTDGSSVSTSEETTESILPPESQTESIPPETESIPPETESIPPETTKIVPTWNTYPANWQVEARQYFVYDCKENVFLVSSSAADTRVYPASITKLFTAYVALEYLDLETQITVSSALDLVSPDSSLAMLVKGDVLTVGQLVEAMLLPSGNDAAYVLAAAAGRVIADSESVNTVSAITGFVSKMNELAAAAGMTGTHFVNPDGMHSAEHYTTLGDLVILGKLAMENPTIMLYAGTATAELSLHGTVVKWTNTNSLINPASSYYCPYAIGLKTGQTSSAGSCLLSAFRTDSHELLIGVFGCPDGTYRFDDTLHLFNQIVLN